jgi:hypothetical protein
MKKNRKVFISAEDIIAIGIGVMGVILLGIILYESI